MMQETIFFKFGVLITTLALETEDSKRGICFLMELFSLTL